MSRKELNLKIRQRAKSYFGFVLQHSTIAVVIFSALIQILLIGRYLDNSIISPYAPTAMDALDYTNRAEIWRTQSFVNAFSDISRMPGYPLLILINQAIFSEYAFLATRYIQLSALAVSAGLIKIVLEKYTSQKVAIFSSLIFIFLPIWHFVPVLIGETVTAVVTVLLIHSLSKIHNKPISRISIFQIAICVATLTYIKPNNILIFVPIFGFLMFSKDSRMIKTFPKLLLVFLILIAPWISFASGAQKGFFGLTANSGLNSYIGTGMILNYDGGTLAKSAIKWGVDPKSNTMDVLIDNRTLNPVERNAVYTEKSIEIWKKRYGKELGFGLEKVKFAFGLNSESRLETTLGLFNIFGFLAGIALLRFRLLRSWGVALLLVTITLSVQAIIFQADRRFVVPIYLPFATLCCGIILSKILKKISYKRAHL